MGLSAGIMAVGAGMSAVGSYNQAKSQQNMLNNEAQIASWQASQEIQKGQQEEENSRLREGALYGAQRAALAANGVDLGSGSALDLLAGTRWQGNKDAATIHDNALRTAWGYSTQASMDRAGASSINPTLSGMSSLLGSAGSVAGSWYAYNRAAGGGGSTVPTQTVNPAGR